MRTAAVLAGALLLGGCASDTRPAGFDPVAAAERGGWGVRTGGDLGGAAAPPPASGGKDEPHDVLFDPPARDPGEVVRVPLEAYAPVDNFFDNEGYLLGDRVVVDCSAEPFMARLVGLAYNDASAKFVVREESREGDVHVVRLWNAASGANYQANMLPRATFGTQHGIRREDPVTGRPLPPRIRPFFEVIGTEELVIRFHMNTSRDLPVFFRARATGTPGTLDPSVIKDCAYVNANRRRLVRGPVLGLLLEIRRGPDGRWTTLIQDPGGAAGEAPGR